VKRLDRLLSERFGLARAEAARLIRQGRVEVDGLVQQDGARKHPEQAQIGLNGELRGPAPRFAIFHKPVDVQCTVGDPWGRANLEEVAGALLAMELHPVGRLDADTSGLLLFSAEGAVTHRLLHPRHEVEKIYLAEVEADPPADLAARLASGVATAEGHHVGRLVEAQGRSLRLGVTEGKHRMVRRMLANLGLPVLRLHREAMGPLQLGELRPGAWRLLSDSELSWLMNLVQGHG
jgi:23S rRNA pseudouridine2605 synthase